MGQFRRFLNSFWEKKLSISIEELLEEINLVVLRKENLTPTLEVKNFWPMNGKNSDEWHHNQVVCAECPFASGMLSIVILLENLE